MTLAATGNNNVRKMTLEAVMLSTYNEQSPWKRPIASRDNKTMMQVLFERMSGTYPNKWATNFQAKDAVAHWEEAWAEAFDEEGITPQDVALGIKNCRQMFDWPPSLPEFLKACRPHLEPNVAFFEAVRGLQARSAGKEGDWSHPAIFYAALAVGQFEMMNQSYQQLRARWEKEFTSQLSLGRWPEIPPVMEALPAPARTEEGKAQARKINDMAGSALANRGIDHKRWARRIVKNPKDRCMFAIESAKTTLGMEAGA